ncbi:MAG: outer membrane lipid asymmetry maintenance protein MlaD [Gammaproteobacteria bacterium]|nr:outer membrane lipid asymmetry maintenance protein MlaD [Gammaproteobacteria bacterium]
MSTKTTELAVGLFTLAGLICLGVLAVKVSGFGLSGHSGTYSLYARFENASGLVKRAKVSISGVIIGEVTDIHFDQETYSARVRMEINEEVDRLTTDTTAVIYTEGLLGGKYIGLMVGAEEDFLADGDEIYDTQSAVVLEELIGKFLFKEK